MRRVLSGNGRRRPAPCAPFGTVDVFEGKLYIQTGKRKAVADQMKANSKIEISGMGAERQMDPSAGGGSAG